MDKIDQLLEEFSLIQSLKKIKDRVFKNKKVKVKSGKIKNKSYFSKVANDSCSKKIATNQVVVDRLSSIEADIEINCVKSNKDFMNEMRQRVNECVKSKNKTRLLKEMALQFSCFNSDDGNLWLYDNKKKDVLYRHHEWSGEPDEFNTSKKDLSFKDLLKEIDPQIKIEQNC